MTQMVLKSTHEGVLRFGDVEVDCYVVEDGRRLLSRRGVLSALSMATGGRSPGRDDELTKFALGKRIKRFVLRLLDRDDENAVIEAFRPARFKPRRGGNSIAGYDASAISLLCSAITEAAASGALLKRQRAIGIAASRLSSAFSRVGVVALIDEATGFQGVRSATELRDLSGTLVQSDARNYRPLFPRHFYDGVYRLKGKRQPADGKHERWMAGVTNQVIYRRLASGTLEKLQRLNPFVDGDRARKHHQHLTEDFGLKQVQALIHAAIVHMDSSSSWGEFAAKMDHSFPIQNDQITLFPSLLDVLVPVSNQHRQAA